LPSNGKIKAELLLNKLNVFSRLSGFYRLLSLLFLGLLFTGVFKPELNLKTAKQNCHWFACIWFYNAHYWPRAYAGTWRAVRRGAMAMNP
jgi:hypothetical protein